MAVRHHFSVSYRWSLVYCAFPLPGSHDLFARSMSLPPPSAPSQLQPLLRCRLGAVPLSPTANHRAQPPLLHCTSHSPGHAPLTLGRSPSSAGPRAQPLLRQPSGAARQPPTFARSPATISAHRSSHQPPTHGGARPYNP